MHVARPQLGRQTVAFTVEQQQRVMANGLKVPVSRLIRARLAKFPSSASISVSKDCNRDFRAGL